MILMEFLFAPTVPSAPRPKNIALVTSGWRMKNVGSTSRLVWVTSSTMPTVKPFLGSLFLSSSKTALTMPGVNSLEDSP